jgi:hypothetical protein
VSPTATAGKEERLICLYRDVNGGANGSMVKREAGRSCVLAEPWRGAAVVERDAGDGTMALLALPALAKRSRVKWSVRNGKGGVLGSV